MSAAGQWAMGIQEVPRPGDHACAADRIVGAAALRTAILGYRIGPIQGVIKRAPARVRRIERIARIHYRHHKLWARNLRNLWVDVVSGDAEGGRLGVQVADLPEKSLVGIGVKRFALVVAMPLINLRLQSVPLPQEPLVLRTQRCPDIGDTPPEVIGINPCARRDLVDQ